MERTQTLHQQQQPRQQQHPHQHVYQEQPLQQPQQQIQTQQQQPAQIAATSAPITEAAFTPTPTTSEHTWNPHYGWTDYDFASKHSETSKKEQHVYVLNVCTGKVAAKQNHVNTYVTQFPENQMFTWIAHKYDSPKLITRLTYQINNPFSDITRAQKLPMCCGTNVRCCDSLYLSKLLGYASSAVHRWQHRRSQATWWMKPMCVLLA